jgi:DNA-binding Lrp family transcriptional regulator
MTEDHKVQVTHVVIPGEVAFNHELTYLDMFVFWMISSLDSGGKRRYCSASNRYMAKRLAVSRRSVANSVTKLVKEGYVTRLVKGNNERILKVNHRYKREKSSLINDYNRVGKKLHRGMQKTATDKDSNKTHRIIYTSLLKKRTAKPRRRIFVKKKLNRFERIVVHWNSFGKPFTSHKLDRNSKIMRKIVKYIGIAFAEGYTIAQIKRSIGDWHSFMEEKNTTLNKKYTFLNRQSLANYFHPDSEMIGQMSAHKPPLKFASPFNEAIKGWNYLTKTYSKSDMYPKITSEMKEIWENKHERKGTLSDFVGVAVKWVDKHEHHTLALDNLDLFKYIVDQVPPHYNCSYLSTKQFWGDFLPEKVRQYEGGN